MSQASTRRTPPPRPATRAATATADGAGECDGDVAGRVAVIVPAAGRGERLGGPVPKALRGIGADGESLLARAVRTLCAAPSVDLVAVAAPPDARADVERLLAPTIAAAGRRVDLLVVAGGATRQASVAAALAALPATARVVLVHDAARALAPVELIERVVAAVRAGESAVIPVLPVVDTIKSVTPHDVAELPGAARVVATVDRAALRAVQTPQGFARTVLERAHAAAVGSAHDERAAATDDAGMVERLGLPVTTVPGDPVAFKVTTPLDLVLAEAVLATQRKAEA
jgi:2-C-methyl-D-erythritol 4-phosphate cytidylyltransferase